MAMTAGLALAAPAAADEHTTGVVPPGEWTTEQEELLLDLVARTEAELPAFGDIPTIEAMGFVDFGISVDGIHHWINRDWIDDEHVLDPSHPESLVFQSGPSGELELAAAMFYLPSTYDMDTIPEDLAWLPGWHVHPELCLDDDGRYAGLSSGGECAVGRVSDDPPMMHVWIVDNACGHRFGGVGAAGLMCGDHAHPPAGPDPHDPHDPPAPSHPDGPHHPPAAGPAPSAGPDPVDPPRAPAAIPVRVRPAYTG